MNEEAIVTEGCLVFETTGPRGVVLNTVSLGELPFVPRVGDVVCLPVPMGEQKLESAFFKVTGVEYGFVPSRGSEQIPESNVTLGQITAYVKRLKR